MQDVWCVFCIQIAALFDQRRAFPCTLQCNFFFCFCDSVKYPEAAPMVVSMCQLQV